MPYFIPNLAYTERASLPIAGDIGRRAQAQGRFRVRLIFLRLAMYCCLEARRSIEVDHHSGEIYQQLINTTMVI